MKVIPFLFFQKPANNLPLYPAHVEDFFFQPRFIIASEPFHVSGIFAHQFRDLRLEARWIGKFAFHRVGSEETAYADSVNLSRRIAGREAHNNGFLSPSG